MRTALFGSLIGLLFLSGCASPIRQVDNVHVANGSVVDRLVFGDYWEAKGLPAKSQAKSKLAVGSFRVEFVEERITRPDQYNRTQFETLFGDSKDAIAESLYEMFLAGFDSRGATVIGRDQVTGASNFARYSRAGGAKAQTLFDTPINVNAGRIRRIDARSPQGFVSVDPKGSQTESIDAALAEELGVDAVLHVTIRVGVWRGRAIIEDGCAIQLYAQDRLMEIRSTRALASDFTVLENPDGGANVYGQYRVDSKRFRSALERLYPVYISLASEAL